MNAAANPVLGIARAELRKALAPRRLWWVALLALAPCALYGLLYVQVHLRFEQRQSWAATAAHHLTPGDFQGVHFNGMSEAQVVARLGPPAFRNEFHARTRGSDDHVRRITVVRLGYSDGHALHEIVLRDGVVTGVANNHPPTLANLSNSFAGVFEFFFLRLAVFFGCLGIFMNLFRAEMLNKSLHYYFLAPVPRARVMWGKFIAGLVVAMGVFCSSLALQSWTVARIAGLAGENLRFLPHTGAYLGVTALGCLGYGAVFLACGLLFRNPIVPAIVLLLWEGMVPFLPAIPQKLSIIYYLIQLSPYPLASSPGTTPLLALFVAPPVPLNPTLAVAGLVGVTALVLWASTRLVRRLEIDYTAD